MEGRTFLTSALPLVQVRRGEYVESVHEVSACVITAAGKVLYAFGDVDQAYPIRSLAKPLLAAEFVRSGAADRYGIQDVELSLAAGSHDGEQRHVTAVRSFLDKLGVTEDMLLCGPALEGKVIVGPPAANNCSGKHTAILAMCCHASLSCDDYIEPTHPIQQRLQAALLKAFGRTREDTPLVVDGCGMPVFAASLRQIATAYAHFGIADDFSTQRVRTAMTVEPGYVGGWFDNLDTRIITWSEGAIIGKIGAEGLHADAIVGRGIGIAVKVRDGNSRALSPVLARLFTRFVDNAPIAQEHFAALNSPPVLNAAGHRVGDIRVTDGFCYQGGSLC